MGTKVTLQELESFLWETANILRGNMDASECYEFNAKIKSKEQIRDFLKKADHAVIAQFKKWWDKYTMSLHSINTQVKESEKLMWKHLKKLGYE